MFSDSGRYLVSHQLTEHLTLSYAGASGHVCNHRYASPLQGGVSVKQDRTRHRNRKLLFEGNRDHVIQELRTSKEIAFRVERQHKLPILLLPRRLRSPQRVDRDVLLVASYCLA